MTNTAQSKPIHYGDTLVREREYKFCWSYRHRDTDEPALLVLSDTPWQTAKVTGIAMAHGFLERPGPRVYLSQLNESEIEMWRAFKLCPVIWIEEKENSDPTLIKSKYGFKDALVRKVE